MQQLLKPSERTQKAADKAAEQHTEQNEKSRDVVGKAEFRRSHHCLKRADRTGTRCRRAGITIEPRYTNSLSFPLINSALQEIRQMKVGQQCRSRLEQSPKMREKLRYAAFFLFHIFVIQFPHTPDTAGLPCSARSLPLLAMLRKTASQLRR